MKFHCDQCKTRYSIADDKVRGKILKIRCKNCSAVITIREAKVAASGPASEPSALHGAFSRAMQKPPTAAMQAAQPPAMPVAPAPELETAPPPVDEWFLSVSGDQEGPFDLAGACRRVSQLVPGEEMFAWQESFDDWLPVEEVATLRASIPATPAPASAPESLPEDDGLFGPSSRVAAAAPGPSEDLFGELAAKAAGGSGEVDHRQSSDPSMDFAVGDVSRVVRMPFGPGGIGDAGSMLPRDPGAADRLPGVGGENGATPRASAAAAKGVGGKVAFDDHVDAPWSAREGHRSTALMLLIGAGVLVVAAASVLVYLNTRGESTERRGARVNTQFATDYYKDNESARPRPRAGGEDRVVKNGNPGNQRTDGRRSNGTRQPEAGRTVRNNGTPAVTPLPGGKVDTFVDEPTNEVLTELTPEEFSAVYRKNKFGMKWCYNRILKRDPEIRVPKMSVVVTVAPSGRVSQVKLPRQNEPLGVCLTNKIRRWRFRKSTGDFTTQFEVVFQH